MKVECEVEYVELEGNYGPVDGVRVTCTRCERSTESFGTGEKSINRCLAMLHNGCDEDNFYVAAEDL